MGLLPASRQNVRLTQAWSLQRNRAARIRQHVPVAVRRWRHMRKTAIVFVILPTVGVAQLEANANHKQRTIVIAEETLERIRMGIGFAGGGGNRR